MHRRARVETIIGSWQVTSLVPSAKVASTWTVGTISGTPAITCSRETMVRPTHQVGHASAVAGPFKDRFGDEGDGLTVIQLQASVTALTGEVGHDVDVELLDLARTEHHRRPPPTPDPHALLEIQVTGWYPPGGGNGTVRPAEDAEPALCSCASAESGVSGPALRQWLLAALICRPARSASGAVTTRSPVPERDDHHRLLHETDRVHS